ncbi:MAG: Hsp20/alpha crystallin family protein [Candidatus Kerfeldbacteria bacterium CG08_land_8_20_14_0_20_40_16]|uniref:Hsp20/alpha crystallin family protein n=1 Tax=Candidatus Kerfeldbacteria bacterium CG08_land_8_20_14_0_20_40_16 TaxID=2014244 RepID=A0A2H0YUK8_9BACT|nr:MAG: Hsp20/alpha crystallin family protein [Candidatus Kerfeldbacteria bacterium CG08_land_8_20_14_0_20_40_16]
MRLIKWTPFLEPWEERDKWLDDWKAGFDSGFVPAIDVYQTKEAVVIETPLAGVDPEKVNISIENDVLTIEGSMEKKSEVEEKDYYRKEMRAGSFHRAVALPVAVEGDKAKADFDNGVLKISIPKSEKTKPKSIKVNVKKKK